MKILNRSIGISHGQITKLSIEKNNIYKSEKIPMTDSAILTVSTTKEMFNTRVHQTELYRYEQADKLLTNLIENIKNLHDQPSVLHQNIKQATESLEKHYPQFTSRLNQIPMNISQLTEEINAIKKEINNGIQEQRKLLSYYLIKEQNKDSISQNPINNEIVNILKKEIKAQSINMHSKFSPSVSRLLSSNQ